MPPTLDILIVEDHADTRRALLRLLTAKGYRTQAAADGKEALQILKDQIPSLIILDRMMPGLDGRGFLKMIRKDPRLKPISVIDYSAALEPYDPDEAAQLGIQAHIPKAAGWEHLLQTTCELLEPQK